MPGFGHRIKSNFQIRAGGVSRRYFQAGSKPQQGNHHHDAGHNLRPGRPVAEGIGRNGADQDGDEGAGFHQGIAPHQLFGAQVLGDDAVLDGAKEGGLSAHQE